MRTARGFAIVDLILIAFVVPMVVLATIATPGLIRVRELAKRTSCAANLNAMGKGFCMYNGENGDRWPWMAGKDWDTTITGKNRQVAEDPDVARSVTALPFMMVRFSGQSPNLFVCPSDMSATVDISFKGDDNKFAMDFSSDRNISYSYACPLVGGNPGVVNGKSSPDLIVMADKTPAYDGGKADTDWSKPNAMTAAQRAAGMSQNHQGEYINMLFIDCHVGNAKDPLVAGDNIYSASGTDDISPAGTIGMANHKSYKESYVIGPVGEKKTTSGPATSPSSKPNSNISASGAD